MRYKLTDEQMEIISAILRRLEGANALIGSLSENVGMDKFNLWEFVYSIYPELRGKPANINEQKKVIVVQEQSQLITASGAKLIPRPGRN